MCVCYYSSNNDNNWTVVGLLEYYTKHIPTILLTNLLLYFSSLRFGTFKLNTPNSLWKGYALYASSNIKHPSTKISDLKSIGSRLKVFRN